MAATESRAATEDHGGRTRSLATVLRRGGPFMAIWPITALLFLVSPLLAHGSLSNSSLQAMLPFAGVLAITAIGQTLVIQQGGLDLSVPGIFSLGVVLVVIVTNGDSSKLPLGLLVVVLAGLAAGLANGLAITRLGITPLVATLGMNGILLGVQQQVTNGSINYTAPSNWASFVGSKIAGITILAFIAVVAIVVVAIVMRRSVWGREFELVGAGPPAARAAGLPVRRYQIASYALAGVCYAVAGALLAGFLGRPQLDAGNEYLLPTIAAVVIGGTALGGGRGSVLATGAGVLFLSQLDQLLQVLGVTQAYQDIIYGAIVALSMGLRSVPWRALLSVGSRRRAGPGTGATSSAMPAGDSTLPTGAPTG
jgi:ribose transport system permease protein